MRKEIEKYFSKYIEAVKKTNDAIMNFNKIIMELDNKIIDSIINNHKNIFVASIYSYDSFFKTMPVKNAYTIITNKSRPKCIIKTLEVQTVKFKDITAEHLKLENNSFNIEKWKQKNIATFELECREAMRVFDINVPIVIETFELVYV